jgi:cytidylate kinase
MWKNIGLDQCLSFIGCQLRAPGGPFREENKPAITLSRMTGSGARTVADRLAGYMQQRTGSQCAWTVFDRNLVEKVLEDHQLPKRIAEYMPERHRSLLDDTVEEILGLHPPSWTLVQQTIETIWKLAKMGNVILLGRGATIVTSKLPTVFHVRLVGSLEKRVERIREARQLSHKAALGFIKKEDRGRRRYIKEHFEADIRDPLLYDLVINTDRIRPEDAAVLIGNTVMEQFHLPCRSPAPQIAEAVS